MPQGPMPLPGVQYVIAVGSGKGGVGKTTCAVNLAVALAKMGHAVGLIDADIYGPNVPMMLGSTRQPNVVNENRMEPILSHGVKFISVGLISPGDKPMVMRGPMLHQIIRQFLQQVEWGALDYLIVDLPPGTGDVVISLVQSVPLTGAIVVSTGSSVALQDARKALEMFHQVHVEVLGMVENMSQMRMPDGSMLDVFGAGRVGRKLRRGSMGWSFWARWTWTRRCARAGIRACRWLWAGAGVCWVERFIRLPRRWWRPRNGWAGMGKG